MQRHGRDDQADALIAQRRGVQPAQRAHALDRDVRKFAVELAGQKTAGRHAHRADHHCPQAAARLFALFQHRAEVHGEKAGFFIRDGRQTECVCRLVAHAAHRSPQISILGAHRLKLRVVDALAARHAQQHGAQVRAQVGAEGGKTSQFYAGLALHAADEQGGKLADAQFLRVVPVLFARGGQQIVLEIDRLVRRQADAERALKRDEQGGRVPPSGGARPCRRQAAAAHLTGQQCQMQHEREKGTVAEHKAAAAFKALQHAGDRLHVLAVEQLECAAVLRLAQKLFPVHLGQLRPQAHAHGAPQVFRRAFQPHADARAPHNRHPAGEQPCAGGIQVSRERVLGDAELFRQPAGLDRLACGKQQGEQPVDALGLGEHGAAAIEQRAQGGALHIVFFQPHALAGAAHKTEARRLQPLFHAGQLAHDRAAADADALAERRRGKPHGRQIGQLADQPPPVVGQYRQMVLLRHACSSFPPVFNNTPE